MQTQCVVHNVRGVRQVLSADTGLARNFVHAATQNPRLSAIVLLARLLLSVTKQSSTSAKPPYRQHGIQTRLRSAKTMRNE